MRRQNTSVAIPRACTQGGRLLSTAGGRMRMASAPEQGGPACVNYATHWQASPGQVLALPSKSTVLSVADASTVYVLAPASASSGTGLGEGVGGGGDGAPRQPSQLCCALCIVLSPLAC